MGGPVDVILPLCAVTELPRLICGHCDSFSMTPVEREYLAGLYGDNSVPGRPDPVGELRIDYGAKRQWNEPDPAALVCDHGKPEGATLCPVCEDSFAATLRDLPELLADLEDALVKRTEFLQAGAPIEQDEEHLVDGVGESPLPYSPAASRVLGQFRTVLGANAAAASRQLLATWKETLRRPDLASLARRITAAAAAAHGVIERPETPLYYGQCPKCGADIYQDRIRSPEVKVKCSCGYRDTLEKHQAAQLDLAEDRHFTLTELVRILCDGGEPTTRQEVENLIYRPGPAMPVLPREKGNRPRWEAGRHVDHKVYVYRLGDVRTSLMLRRLQNRHAKH